MSAGRPRALDLEIAMPGILRLFWHDGYGGLTLNQVADELGVTKPTLCRTLGEKEAIAAAADNLRRRATIRAHGPQGWTDDGVDRR